MATLERITLVCDGCGSTNDVRTEPIRFGRRKTRYVEVCAPCREPVDKLMAAGRTDPTPPTIVDA